MKEALKLALEALEPFITPNWAGTGVDKANEAYAAIKEALAQPEQKCPNLENCKGLCFQCEYFDSKTGETTYPKPEQEPVAVWELQEDGWDTICDGDWLETLPVGTKLYTTPPKREWVGLTDEDIGQWIEEEHDVIRWAEAKLKEKNS